MACRGTLLVHVDSILYANTQSEASDNIASQEIHRCFACGRMIVHSSKFFSLTMFEKGGIESNAQLVVQNANNVRVQTPRSHMSNNVQSRLLK